MAEDEYVGATEKVGIDFNAKLRYEREREKDAQRQKGLTNNQSVKEGSTVQDLWREWLDSSGTVNEANERISGKIEADKYAPNAGKIPALQEQMLETLENLERDGPDNDRSR